MGLFGFLKKAVGKVAKAGLSIVTHGASDKVLKAIKASAGSKSPRQQEALIAKLEPVAPRTKNTERHIPGWGFASDGYGGGKRARTYGKRRAAGGKGSWRSTGAVELDASGAPTGREWFNATGEQDFEAPGEYRPVRAGKARRMGRKRARRPAAARTGRKAPKGGLNLKALSTAWKAAGKPGTWQGWIKAQGANYRS